MKIKAGKWRGRVLLCIVVMLAIILWLSQPILSEGVRVYDNLFEIQRNNQRRDETKNFASDMILTAELSDSDDYNTGNDSIYLDDLYSTQYFYNLRENFGYNMYGSCGFIAMGMLLSFYDTYWDDDIVGDNYEVKTEIEASTLNNAFREEEAPYSPGIRNDYSIMKNMTEYYMLRDIYTNRDYYLQCELMALARDNGLMSDFPTTLTSSSFGLNFSEVLSIMHQYLTDNNLEDISIEYASTNDFETDAATAVENDVYDFVVGKVSQGIPVVASIEGNSSAGHLVVVYDYNETAETVFDGLYAHYGWYYGSAAYTPTHTSLGEYSYTQISSAFALDISDIDHSCSDNYYLTSDYYTKEYCPCALGCHPKHAHKATSSSAYEEYDDTYHYLTCYYCNACVLQSHSLTGVQYNGWMCSYCPLCGYREQLYEIGV